MPRKGHTPEQIIGKLREAEVGMASGQTVPEVGRTLPEEVEQWSLTTLREKLVRQAVFATGNVPCRAHDLSD